ncbi:putative diguanylate cyclase YedQ [compost metagenome]
MFLGACLLVGQWRTASTAYRKQIFTLFLGTMLPITASFLYLMGLVPYNMDPVPFILIFTTSLYVWAIRTTDLFQVVPIARGYVFESMRDGVLVLDLAGRLVDYNPAARRMIPALSPERIGDALDAVWVKEPGSDKLPQEVPGQGNSEQTWRTRWTGAGEERHYEIRSLPVRVKSQRQVGRMLMLIDVTEHVRYEEKLLRLASYDGLTGIYNRARFMEEAGGLLAEAEENRSGLSLVLFDVDHFKNINDRLGHSAGDRALVHLIDICRRELREGEFLGRYGGEEFVLCLPGIGLAEAGRRTERIRAAIAGSALSTAAGPLRLTASFGVVEAGGAAGYELEPLLHAADQALYRAKAGGRNAVHCSLGAG